MRRIATWLLAALLLASPALADSGQGVVSANSTNCTAPIVKGPSHFLTGLTMGNTGAAAWVKFYDMATTPSAGASQGVTPGGNPYVFPIPGNSALAGSNMMQLNIEFHQGIAYCITGGAANNDTTAVSAAQVAGTLFYK